MLEFFDLAAVKTVEFSPFANLPTAFIVILSDNLGFSDVIW
ncbi:hypothetical protein [Spiroplasma endosymbiont of Polydrusus formosus]